MKKLLLSIIILFTATHTSYSAEETDPDYPTIRAEMSTTKRITRNPIKKPRKKPRKRPFIHHHYYTWTIEKNCDSYINIINEKNREIEALTQEIKNLRANKYETMRQKLKENYEKELRKFEERWRKMKPVTVSFSITYVDIIMNKTNMVYGIKTLSNAFKASFTYNPKITLPNN